MKVLRTILIVLGLLLIVSQLSFIISTLNKPRVFEGKTLNFFDSYQLELLAIVIGVVLLYFAYRISKGIKKRKANDLLKSFLK